MVRSIVYDDQAKRFVEHYGDNPDLQHSTFWETEGCVQIRKAIKEYYIAEQHHKCCYCARVFPTANNRVWDAEHIAPRSKYPRFMFEPLNLAIACIDCNNAKGVTDVFVRPQDYKKYPVRSESYRIVHPHFDEYDEHIRHFGSGVLKAYSEKGSFTISVCNLLRFGYEKAGADAELAANHLLLQLAEELAVATTEEQKRLALEKIKVVATLQQLR